MKILLTLAIFLAFASTVPVHANEATCELCISIVEAVENYVAQGLTFEEILVQIEASICDPLGLLSGWCKGFIDDQLRPIINNLEDNLAPFEICGTLGPCSDVIPTPAPPKPWSFIETHLDGGKVLSARYDGTNLVMWGKSHGSDREYELWRLENNGCLRNKKYPKKCLGTGAQLHTEHEFLEADQKWNFKEGILERESDTHVLNVIWADVPLVTDGVAVNIIKRDGTTSMFWSFVEP